MLPILMLAAQLHADGAFKAQLYARGTKTLLFSLEASDSPEKSVRNYQDASGAAAVIETVDLREGKPSAYSFDQRQLGEYGQLKVGEKNLELSYYAAGATRTAQAPLPPALILGPLIAGYAREHWKEWMAGKTTQATVPVLSKERLMTASLEFFRSPQDEPGADEKVIIMKPASWFVALFLKPDYLYFSADGATLKRISGPTLLKTRQGSEWKNTECDVVYEAPK